MLQKITRESKKHNGPRLGLPTGLDQYDAVATNYSPSVAPPVAPGTGYTGLYRASGAAGETPS